MPVDAEFATYKRSKKSSVNMFLNEVVFYGKKRRKSRALGHTV